MVTYIWLFPLLFIFHDMEEIVGFMPWMNKHKQLLQEKAPLFLRLHDGLSTEGFALAVFEELIIVFIFSLVALIGHHRILYLIWLGGFVAYALHLLVHILQALFFRQYIPSLATSLICLPISCWIIGKVSLLLQFNWAELLVFSVIGCLIVGINLILALTLGEQFSKWLEKKQLL